ncbi:Signal peptidase complex catalytic subunit SEC11C [Dichanthelium oligosanthes]|uniref:Signal peptidase complex catalytic subunit SEC11 n=1 Tax=Dichanthelium oligosanthes TaxID=888268 RepID=A0A1E5UR32_9POAL|nr:Signal peptidase complex catalytic subunit SEC11C [Dichanthelium oligosanthes]
MDNDGAIRRHLGARRTLSQLIMLGVLLAHLLMAYNAVTAATGAEFTAMVVMSGSMEPGIKRGDLVLFCKSGDGDHPIRTGDIVLYEPAYGDFPVVHRVIKVHERRGGGGGGVDILTKGDNNSVDDSVFVYSESDPWLHRRHVMANAVGYVPNAGWFSVALNEKPAVRRAAFGVLGLGMLATALF